MPIKLNEYEYMVELTMNCDISVDFKKLRLAFTKTEYYRPYDESLKELRTKMNSALNSNRFSEALNFAKSILEICHLDIEAHIVCEICYGELEDLEKMKFHNYMRDGLIKSILTSGDGVSPNTAYLVISLSEEYATMAILQYNVELQKLIKGENGRYYDLLTVRDPESNEKLDYYFDVSIPYQWIGKQITKNKVE